jgi:hypothetical protein
LCATLAIATHARAAPAPPPAPQPTIMDPESHEPPAFVPLKTLDEWCLHQQLPHIFEITGLDGWLSIASWLAFLYPATLPFLRSVLDLGDQFPTADAAGAERSTSHQEAGLRILRKMREALENRPR